VSTLCTLTQPEKNQLIIRHKHVYLKQNIVQIVYLKQNNVQIIKFDSPRSFVVWILAWKTDDVATFLMIIYLWYSEMHCRVNILMGSLKRK
jgi:hypothetical protein